MSELASRAEAWSPEHTLIRGERRTLLAWETLLAGVVVIVFLVPIKRYAMPGDLPFGLEPYRLVVAAVLLVWLGALLVDPRTHLRRSVLDLPLLAFAGSALASVAVNPRAVELGDSAAVKQTVFLLSFVLLYFLIVSVVRRIDQAVFLAEVLVVAGAVVGGAAIVESSTGFNVFNHLGGLPFLRMTSIPDLDVRGTALRAYASAQHPIALGAALVMLVPLAAALVRVTGRVRWWIPGAALGLGAVASVSRTAMLMLATVLLVGLWIRPRDTFRIWLALIPAALLLYLFAPAAGESLQRAFSPEGGLVAEQRGSAGSKGSGRLADVAPAFQEFSRQPILGQGYGSRDVDDPTQPIAILDNQWLGTLLETGALGLLSLLWLLIRFLRRAGAAARRDGTARGSLVGALATATAAYGVGMLTFDSFSFIQVTFVFFIMLGLGSALLAIPPASTRRELPGGGRASRGADRGGAERVAAL